MREAFITAVADMEEDEAIRLAGAMLDAGTDPRDVLDAAKEAMASSARATRRRTTSCPS